MSVVVLSTDIKIIFISDTKPKATQTHEHVLELYLLHRRGQSLGLGEPHGKTSSFDYN